MGHGKKKVGGARARKTASRPLSVAFATDGVTIMGGASDGTLAALPTIPWPKAIEGLRALVLALLDAHGKDAFEAVFTARGWRRTTRQQYEEHEAQKRARARKTRAKCAAARKRRKTRG